MRVMVTAGLVVFAAAAQAVARPLPPPSELRARVERFVGPLAADRQLSGCLLLSRGAEVVYERCFGFADAELGVVNTPDTRFNVGAVGQVLTQLVFARLTDERRLAPADPVSRWLPRFPHRMTVAQLAGHESGIPSRLTTDEQETLPRAPADLVELASAHPLRFTPGSRREESVAGYAVLAHVFERAARAPWADVLRTTVLDPVGMSRSAHVTARDVVPGRASGYLPSPGGEVRPAPPKDLSTFVGAGSVVSTARDLFLLVRALRDGKLGPGAASWAASQPRFSLGGSAHGFATFVEEDPATGNLAVFTGNLPTAAVDHLRSVVLRLAAGERVAVPRRDPAKTPGVP